MGNKKNPASGRPGRLIDSQPDLRMAINLEKELGKAGRRCLLGAYAQSPISRL